jgi:hypothetical protein
MTSSIIVGLLARQGVYDMAASVIRQVVNDPRVKGVWVITPQGKYRDAEVLSGPKVAHIDRWEGENPSARIGFNREVLRKNIYSSLNDYGFSQLMADIEWIWIGDADALPAADYFETLSRMKYDYPVLLTGRTLNADGSRYLDICSVDKNGQHRAIPYDDWESGQYSSQIYAASSQHVMNRLAFDLNVRYQDTPLEDANYCHMLRGFGAKIVFRPELSMQLQKLRPPIS